MGEVAPAIRRALSVPIPTNLSVPELRDLARAVASAQLGIVAAMEEDDVRGSATMEWDGAPSHNNLIVGPPPTPPRCAGGRAIAVS